MNINELAKDIYLNAVAHGWWEGERPIEEVITLIHSEWSEALEEARAGRPMAYQKQSYGIVVGRIEEDMNKWFPHEKPEGIAVELIDGCIRILDYFGAESVQFEDGVEIAGLAAGLPNISLARLVADLHFETARAYECVREDKYEFGIAYIHLARCVSYVCKWVAEQGLDVERLMLKKHEYNKGRPYKHGKRF